MLVRFYGCVFFASCGFFASLGLGENSVAAQPAPAADAASPVASPAPCASAGSDPRDLPAAFAYDLESPDILRFIRGLAAVPERDQKRIFDAAIEAAKNRPEQAVQAAVDSQCPRSDAVYGALRATYVIVNDWTLDELRDPERFEAFDAVVRTAVSALSLGDELTPEQRLTATRPFIGFDVEAPAHPLPQASGACSNTDARTLTLARPTYPPNAVSARTTGKVHVKVRLSETGDVRSATVLSDTLGTAIGGEDIRRASIFAAATTTYAPAIRNCVPRRGSYIFATDFVGR